MAFISLGSVASDLSFTHLINHILIPELAQSERLTDTQLQGMYENNNRANLINLF
jgi:hypothetical protein